MKKFHITCPSIRQFKSIMQEISAIESQCYPLYMQSMQGMQTKAKLIQYCESEDVFILQNSTTYCICTEDEVIDLASSTDLSMKEMNEIKEFLKETFGNKQFFLDARKSTSYRLIKFLEKRGEITIISEEEWLWGQIYFCSINLKFN